MSGLIKGFEMLSGALQKAYMAAHDLRKDPKLLAQIGSITNDSARSNPNYFATGADLPKGMSNKDMAEYLSNKHGIDMTATKSGHVYIQGDPDGADQLMTMSKLGQVKNNQQLMGSSLIKNGLVTPNADMYNIDTMMAPRGSGVARQSYPGFWDYLLSQPDAVNATQALSVSNQVRRNANMAPLYEKYGKDANRVVMDPTQLSTSDILDASGNAITSRFHDLGTDQQVGALNAAIGTRAGYEVQYAGQRLAQKHALDPSELTSQYMARAKELGIDPGTPWKATTDVDPGYFKSLADWLHNSSGVFNSVPSSGENSLRRAALTSDAVEGLGAKDIGNQPWLTDGLGRKAGGSVPKSAVLGPLSNLWV